jgi:Tfp pilus assembly protein PilN
MAAKTLVNLLPREDFEKTTLGRIMKWALTSFRIIVIAVEFVVISGFLFRFWLDVQISDLDDEITQKAALISSKSDFERDFRRAQTKLNLFSEVTGPENVSLGTFQEVVASLPADTQLISFSRQADTLLIAGATLFENSITGFITNLEAKDRFSTVTLKQISTKAGEPLIEFSLEIALARGIGI